MFAVGESLKRIMTLIYLTFFMGGLAWNWWNMYQVLYFRFVLYIMIQIRLEPFVVI